MVKNKAKALRQEMLTNVANKFGVDFFCQVYLTNETLNHSHLQNVHNVFPMWSLLKRKEDNVMKINAWCLLKFRVALAE